MADKSTKSAPYAVGPIGAVATVPGDFISGAIFEIVQGALRLGGKVARSMRRS